MKFQFENFFINKTKDRDLVLNGLNYDLFIDLILRRFNFSYAFRRATLNPEIVRKRQLFYKFYRMIDYHEFLATLYWIVQFQKTRKVGNYRKQKGGTISNFVYMNKNKIPMSESDFSNRLKIMYILVERNLFGKVLKRLYFKHSKVTENELVEMLEKHDDIELIYEYLLKIKEDQELRQAA